MSDISLTASMRSNLLSLQNTQSLMDMTQERLSTGKKVNSAIDNPSSYYTAASLNNRASDLSALLDSMGQGIQTIKAADEGIEAITAFAEQAKALANTARDEAVKDTKGSVELAVADDFKAAAAKADTITFTVTNLADGTSREIKYEAAENATKDDANTAIKAVLTGDGIAKAEVADGKVSVEAALGYKIEVTGSTGGFAGKVNSTAASNGNANRVKSAAQFDSILAQIDQLAADSGYKGVNLLQKNNLKVVFNEDRSSSIEVKGVDASSKGLEIDKAVGGWQTDSDIDDAITAVENAISTLRAYATDFGNNYSIVQNREDFTENLINVLTEGADKLTLADMNEESANMLALQTRQQLAVNSLSLASQAAQSVLRLF